MDAKHKMALEVLHEAIRRLRLVTVALSEIAPAGSNGTSQEDTQKIAYTKAPQVTIEARGKLENIHFRLSQYLAGL